MIKLFSLLVTILTFLDVASSLPQDFNSTFNIDSAKEDQVICIDPLPLYPSWAGAKLVRSDCLAAWKRLFIRIGPQIGTQRFFTYWFQPPAPSTPLNHRTPIGEVEGSCHVAIAMIRSIPLRDSEGIQRILPERMSIGYIERPVVDEALASQIHDAVDRNAWCLQNLGLPGAWFAGKQEGIGVFFWSSDSDISKKYRAPVGDESTGTFQLGTGDNSTEYEVFAR